MTLKGCGFVSYKNMSITKPVTEMNGYMFQNRRLYVGRTKNKTERIEETKIFF